jgi:integrase
MFTIINVSIREFLNKKLFEMQLAQGKRISVEDFAKTFGISQSLMSMWLNGTRPIHCVDLSRHAISQLPEFGVRTKNHKAAITYLLPIPELMPVLQRWQSLLTTFNLPLSTLWYATISRDGDRLTPTTTAFNGRHNTVERDIRKLCNQYDLKYLSPHKLRHGHVVYAVQRAKTMQQLKGISLNIMHKSVVTTDAVYNRLVGEDVKNVIESLS